MKINYHINLSLPFTKIRYGKKFTQYTLFKPWNLFATHFTGSLIQYGFGLLQFGQRHLFYIGYHSQTDKNHPYSCLTLTGLFLPKKLYISRNGIKQNDYYYS